MANERPNTAAEVAAALRTVADKFAALGEAPLPGVGVSVDILPHGGEEVEMAAIDLIGGALYGRPGQTRELSGGIYHHTAGAIVAGISVTAFTRVTPPAEREMRAELDRLRAELAAANGTGQVSA
ncbi:hypothetical protein ABGB16_29820 [Micromonospora sp. B11E3]|uniref:hypothetical protein n=1 Tax=Micromonospora sp. B11E3 TaxID=3153562 RepID=UPI00325CA0F3